MSRDTLQVLDLFSGIGGFSLGLERAGEFRTIGFCEIDSHARRVLRRHWPDVPIHDDVRQLSATGIVDRVDVVCGGFPCQDISFAGQGAGLSGARSGLWFEMFRVITETRPSYVIIENVAALRSRGLDVVLGCLASIGYDAEWHCIPAAAVGAPHRRDRIWIIAYPAGTRFESPRFAEADTERSFSQPQRGVQQQFDTGDDGGNGNVADAEHTRRDAVRLFGYGETADSMGERSSGAALRQGSHVPDADRTGLEVGQRQPGDAGPKLTTIERADWWLVEPDVGRVAHGIPARVDRLKCLGNSIVPQIAQLIGEAILREHR